MAERDDEDQVDRRHGVERPLGEPLREPKREVSLALRSPSVAEFAARKRQSFCRSSGGDCPKPVHDRRRIRAQWRHQVGLNVGRATSSCSPSTLESKRRQGDGEHDEPAAHSPNGIDGVAGPDRGGHNQPDRCAADKQSDGQFDHRVQPFAPRGWIWAVVVHQSGWAGLIATESINLYTGSR